MTTPVYDEQFLPRLVAIFFATFHPTEGPKVVYQVPEGSIAQDGDDQTSEVDSNQESLHDEEDRDQDDDDDLNQSIDSTHQFKESVERHKLYTEDFISNQEQTSQEPSLPSVDEVTTPSAASSFQTGYNDPRPPIVDQNFNSNDTEIGPGASDFTVSRGQGISNFTIRDEGAMSSGLSSLDTLSLPLISSSSSSSPGCGGVGALDSDESDEDNPTQSRPDRRRFSRDSSGRPQIRASSEASKATSAYSTGVNSNSRFHRSGGNGSKPSEPLFDFSPLAEYVIPKAPLCGRLVTCTTRARTSTISNEETTAETSFKNTRSRNRNGKSVSRAGSRTSSVAPSISRSRLRSLNTSPNSSTNDLPGQNDTNFNNNHSPSSRTTSSSYKILSHPVLINDPVKYARNTYIFNIGFVFDGRADTRAYEPVVRKCARVVRGLEEASSFLSNPASMPRMYGIIEQLFEDLNSYCESFVALPDTPHTNWIQKQLNKNKASRGENQSQSGRHDSIASGNSNPLGRPAFISRTASTSSSGSELPNPQLKEEADLQARARLFSHSSNASSNGKGSNAALIALLAQTPASLSRRVSTEVLASTSNSSEILSELTSPISPKFGNQELSSSVTSSSNSQSTASTSIPTSRPSIGRSTTAAAVTPATVTTATIPKVEVGSNEQSSKVLNGTVIVDQNSSESGEDIKNNVNSNPLPKTSSTTPLLASSISSATPSRVTSGGSTSTNGGESIPNNISESILSLRTIGAASENRAPPTTAIAGTEIGSLSKSINSNNNNNNKKNASVNASKPVEGSPQPSNPALGAGAESRSGAVAVSLPGRRDPPHGLGRTVRDAINLKLFPTYANPPPVNDWDVPVALLRLEKMVDANWDLTMARVCPYIDGVNHVKRIAQMADADLELTRQCMEHLIYYGCIILTDLFQFFNMYTVRPLISRMAADPVVRLECPTYVTRPGYSAPSYPTLLRLYSVLRPGLTLHEWIEENEAEVDLDSMGIDVRRFVSFGVIKGFLRRVHRYPILLPEDFDLEKEDKNTATKSQNQERGRAPSFGAGENSGLTASRSGSALERIKGGGSGSREREYKPPTSVRAHRDSDGPAMSGIDLRNKSNSRSREREDKSNENSTSQQPRPPRLRGEPSETESIITINDYGIRERLPSNRTSSWGRSDSPHTQPETSPTKRQLNKPSNRSRKSHRHPTATVVDVATIALEHLHENQESHRPQSGGGGGNGISLQAQGRTSSFKRTNSTGFPPSPSKKASFTNVPNSSFNNSNKGPVGSSSRDGNERFPRSTSFGPDAAQSSGIFEPSSRSITCLPIPAELPELLDGTHCDDELCVRFGLSWSELQKMLIVIGTTPSNRNHRSGSGDREGGNYSDEEMNHIRESGYNSTTDNTNGQSTSAFTSGYGNVSSASGYIRRSFPRSKRSNNALRGASGNATAGGGGGGRSSSGWGVGASTSRINSFGWNAESEGAMNSGWASLGGSSSSLSQKALERGDYGRVKILLR